MYTFLKHIEQASPIDRRSTNSRSSRLCERSSEMTQGTQDALRNMYKTCWKYAWNGTRMNEMLAAIRCMLVSRGRAPRYGTFSSELCCGLSLSRRVQNNRMNENRCPEGSKDGLEGRTQCTKQHEKYLKMYPKSLQIVARRGPKSKEIVVWRGLWVHSGMFGAFRSEF